MSFKKALANHESRQEEVESPAFDEIAVSSQPIPIQDIVVQQIGSDSETGSVAPCEDGEEMSKERFRQARKRKAALRSAVMKNLPKKVKKTSSVKSVASARPNSPALNLKKVQEVSDQTLSILTHFEAEEEVARTKEIIQKYETVVDMVQVHHWIQVSDYIFDRNLEHLTEQPIKREDSLKTKFWKATLMLLNKAYEDWRSTEESTPLYRKLKKKSADEDVGSPPVFDPYPDMDTFYNIVDNIIGSAPAETNWPSSNTYVRRSETEGVSLSAKQGSAPYFVDLKWYEKRRTKSMDSREMWRYAEFRSKHQFQKNGPIYRAIMSLQQAILQELREKGASSTLTSLKK
ncbi:hypothetical protein GE061_001124 [Apolygus lucorum]|uniref:Uncharacterized protein n=1 Tax=Apolygus lucorum TaxID=248454 RepID=A0A8S9Y7D9_APOLU|nr:hypothetical protein GE061_001124 [Apolygus lucorum]